MKAQVYRFRIEYAGYGDSINRTVEVSSNYTLAELGYLILAAFDTLAYHAFYIDCAGERFCLTPEPNDASRKGLTDVREVMLHEFSFHPGDTMEMTYDYGCRHSFVITFEQASEMAAGKGAAYPKLISGAGKGILDNISPHDFGEIVKRIDQDGKSEHIYLSPDGKEVLWDYRQFDCKSVGRSLKRKIAAIANRFGP